MPFIALVTLVGDRHQVLGVVLNDGTPLKLVEVRVDDGPWQPAMLDSAVLVSHSPRKAPLQRLRWRWRWAACGVTDMWRDPGSRDDGRQTGSALLLEQEPQVLVNEQ